MKWKFKCLPSLEAGTTYSGKIVSYKPVDEDTDKERILIYVEVEGFIAPDPASFSLANPQGSNMFNKLVYHLGIKEDNDTKKVLDQMINKEVKVKVKVNGDYINTSIYAPNQQITETTTPIESKASKIKLIKVEETPA